MNLVESIRKDLNLLEAPLELTSVPMYDHIELGKRIDQCDMIKSRDHGLLFIVAAIYNFEDFVNQEDPYEPYVSASYESDDTNSDIVHIYFKDIVADPENYKFYTLNEKDITLR